MRVIHVPKRFLPNMWGGIETHVLEIARRLKSHDIEAEVFCPSEIDSPGDEEIQGVRIRRFPYFYPYKDLSREQADRMGRRGGNLFSLALLRALRREPNVDLIHLHTGKRLGGIGRHVARSRHIPYIVTVHGGAVSITHEERHDHLDPSKGSLEWGRALGSWAGSRNVLEDAETVIFVNREEAEKARALQHLEGGDLPRPDRVRYLPGGVDVDRFVNGDGRRFRQQYGISDGEPVVVTAARIEPRKNQLDAIRIFDLVRQTLREGTLFLVGAVADQEYFDQVQTEIQKHGLTDSVVMLTELDPRGQEVVDVYHAADCLLLPSVQEPFGQVILEAWAAGCPVVTSQTAGPRSFTRHAEDVLQFPLSDLDMAAEQVIRVLVNPDLADSLAETGNRRARTEFDWEVITAKLAKWYREAVGLQLLSAEKSEPLLLQRRGFGEMW